MGAHQPLRIGVRQLDAGHGPITAKLDVACPGARLDALLSASAVAVAPVFLGVALIGTVLAAVHHAELVAHRVGEPLGTFLLAVAVTVIELGLIITLMAAGGEMRDLARDTVSPRS